MRIGLVITVKNEARLLRQNVLYHLGIGVARIYIYLDGTTDGSEATVADLQQVVVEPSVTPETYQGQHVLKKFHDQASEHHTARQCLNTYDALQKCKQDGIDWLISLDADELFLTNNMGAEALTDFFSPYVTEHYDVIQFSVLEVVSRKLSYNHVMAEETLFKRQKNFSSRLDRLYRKVYNPYTKSCLTTSYWLGHTMGKAAINVNGDVIPYNVHRYVMQNGKPPKIKVAGHVLHYHLYDFEDFIKKYKNFKNRADTFLSGNAIEPLKKLWIQLVNDPDYDIEYLKDYYEQNIHFNTKALSALYKTRLFNVLKRRESAVVNITKPKEVLINREGQNYFDGISD
ncbi:glycosyltransferase family 2 protein [Aestuariibaculum marinum]|uniref:Glycosyltransferase family 2 protein n=1 Tax=Aestuariibaculum marinum TaxID=2683592 RepID=A0A8J6U5L4_9FLAO|nr:glycosyltransferase family 2 protein [Aestuariibaculum marinum]MBD0823874.1 glycosyltransferase family 2 protein [Aestuariibaculum marinum]